MNMLTALRLDDLTSQLDTLSNATAGEFNAFREADTKLEAIIATINANTNLSLEGKQKQIDTARAQTMRDKQHYLETFVRFAKQDEQSLAAQANPKALEGAPALAETRLGNARADARMMLDGVEKGELLELMSEITAGDDPALTHLMLTTPWPNHYLTSRAAPGFIAEWESQKAQLLHLVNENPEAVTKLQTIKTIHEEATDLMRQALERETRVTTLGDKATDALEAVTA